MSEPGLRAIRSRQTMVRFFDGLAAERMEELDERKLRRPLVKTHLLELLNGQTPCGSEELRRIFYRRGVELDEVEEGLFLVRDRNGPPEGIGLLERLRPRVVALYSVLKSDALIPWVRRLVYRSPELDHVWLSGLTFGVLWDVLVRLTRPHRFTQLVFKHDSIFHIDAEDAAPAGQAAEGDEEDDAEDRDAEETQEVRERRATSFRLVDRVGVIQERLEQLQRLYSPLYAISQLRFPSPIGRGGHDFYDNGRVTNRSQSFRDHRSHILFVVRIYEQLLRATEEQAWYSIQESVSIPSEFRKIVGAPVVVRFREPLTDVVFDHWIAATFSRKRNRFRLWGHPIRLGPTKVHVYGVDRHLWRPLFLELTAEHCIAIVPNGTCGNTVHRLVTNIQRYLDPGAEAFIGAVAYKTMVEEATRGVPYAVATT